MLQFANNLSESRYPLLKGPILFEKSKVLKYVNKTRVVELKFEKTKTKQKNVRFYSFTYMFQYLHF